jgi:hypothetical protein
MTNTIQVRKAKREKLIAAVAFAGPSGSGKTLGALLAAYGLIDAKYPNLSEEEKWDKVALIDTEHERSLVYEGAEVQGTKIGQFLFVSLEAPYTLARYEAAVKAAKSAGAEIVVIDSTSHAWDAEGGLLDLQQQKGGNFQAWRDVNPVYSQFINLITGVTFKIHTFSTIRTKQEYHVDRTETGKLEIKKLGLKTVQRDSLEYELQLVFNIDMDHTAKPGKDNTLGLFDRQQVIGPDVGRKLYQWLEAGIDVRAKEEEDRQEFLRMIREMQESYGGSVSEKVKEIEGAMKKPIEDLPFNLVQLAYKRVNDLISELEQAESEIKAAQAQ